MAVTHRPTYPISSSTFFWLAIPVEEMPCGITALVTAARASNYVVGVEATFSLVQIGEEEDRRLAFVASDDDVPGPRLGGKHGGTIFRRGRFGAGHNRDGRLSSSAQTNLPNLQPAE